MPRIGFRMRQIHGQVISIAIFSKSCLLFSRFGEVRSQQFLLLKMAPKAKHYAQSLVDEGRAVLARDGVDAPMTVTMDMIEFLMKHNIAVKETHHSKYFLVHLKNRGGLLVNAFNCHQNGIGIKTAGADLAELHNAVALELPPFGNKVRKDLRARKLLSCNVKVWFSMHDLVGTYGPNCLHVDFAPRLTKHVVFVRVVFVWTYRITLMRTSKSARLRRTC